MDLWKTWEDNSESSCIHYIQGTVFLPSISDSDACVSKLSYWEVLGYTVEEIEWGGFGFREQLALSGYSITWLLEQQSMGVAGCSGGNCKLADSRCLWNIRTANVTKFQPYKIVRLRLLIYFSLQTETLLVNLQVEDFCKSK